MNPEEKVLLERTLKLSEENNQILRQMRRTARWAVVWGFIKAALIIVPLILGYLYLQPFFDQILENYSSAQELIKSLPR